MGKVDSVHLLNLYGSLQVVLGVFDIGGLRIFLRSMHTYSFLDFLDFTLDFLIHLGRGWHLPSVAASLLDEDSSPTPVPSSATGKI